MTLPALPPATTSPAALKTWTTDVHDTAVDHDDRIADLETDSMPKTGGTFTGDIVVPAEAYGSGWNGSNEAPTKNDVYDKMETVSAAAGSGVVDYARAVRTSGNVTINGTSWANVDTGVDLVLSASTGDLIEVAICARLAAGAANTDTLFDVATIVSASPVNYFGTAGGASDEGVIGWRCKDTVDTAFGCSVSRILVSGDISSGTVTLRLRVRQSSAGNRSFVAGTANPFSWYAKNLGPG